MICMKLFSRYVPSFSDVGTSLMAATQRYLLMRTPVVSASLSMQSSSLLCQLLRLNNCIHLLPNRHRIILRNVHFIHKYFRFSTHWCADSAWTNQIVQINKVDIGQPFSRPLGQIPYCIIQRNVSQWLAVGIARPSLPLPGCSSQALGWIKGQRR